MVSEEDLQLKTIPGQPVKDYPIFDFIPKTTFTCQGREAGYFADQEANCQVVPKIVNFNICDYYNSFLGFSRMWIGRS